MKKSVAFICVHNSCRSQIAEALMKKYESEHFHVFSAGTELKGGINPDAIRLMKQIYGIDMGKDQRSKLLTEIPAVDYVVTMGCNVLCPVLPFEYQSEDWGLDDPSGQSDEVFRQTIGLIDQKVKDFIQRKTGK